jgi:sulfate adenylyltransferase large subunit
MPSSPGFFPYSSLKPVARAGANAHRGDAHRREPGDTFETLLARATDSELLRFITAGSVDDGKSTFTGRLLYDCRAVYEDQLAAVKSGRLNRSAGPVDFSLLTDGLRAEREQGITIDVAYRYFASPKRRFIIADTPGHAQYTRNMATGASTANAAVIMLDATRGVLEQSKRHACIAHLLGIPSIIVAVNKMDLVGYDEEVFRRHEFDMAEFARRLGIASLALVPISALEGDNVVHRSARMAWYDGPSVLERLEAVPAGNAAPAFPLRFPVQIVIRPDSSFRGYAGRIAAGEMAAGDEVVALPSGIRTRIEAIETFAGPLERAPAGDSVVVRLRDEIDLGRGDMLAAAESEPATLRNFRADLVWMDARALDPARRYLLKHTTRQTQARVVGLEYRLNIHTLEREPAASLAMNDIGAVEIRTAHPLLLDSYAASRETGGFILMDPATNATVAAGMVRDGG